MRLRRASLGALAVATIAACGSESTSVQNSPRTFGIRIVSGSNVTDTADALLSLPLIVEVHDSAGKVAPLGTVVRFESQVGDVGYNLGIADLTSQSYNIFATGRTDASGRTGVTVQLGEHPGAARLAIDAPTLGVRDTARFSIVPAAASRIDFTPADTTLVVGGSFTIRGAVYDRFGNARTDNITFSIARPGAAVSPTGVVTTSAVGAYTLSAVAGGFTGTTIIGVAPPGLLTAFHAPSGDIVTVDILGQNMERRSTATNGGIGLRPRWVGSTDAVIYSTLIDVLQVLEIAEPTGETHPLFPVRPSFITHAADPWVSANGEWVYFDAFSPNCASKDYCLHRAHLDGSGAATMAATAALTDRTIRPSSSPDGRSVAFEIEGALRSQIRVLDTDTQQISAWSVEGSYPLWSPNGAMIAFRNARGDIRVIASDGTNNRGIVQGDGTLHYPGISWSPDSHWILFHNLFGGRVAIVNVQTGERITIKTLDAFYDMQWK